MKKSIKGIVSLALGLVMVGSAFTGCQGNKETAGEEKNLSGSDQTTVEKPTKIRIMNRVNPDVKIDDNPLLQEVEKRLNLEIEYEAPPINNYVDKLQIVMASGDLPDIIYNWGGGDLNYETWAKNGLLAELDDKIKNYPHLMSNISKEMWESIRSLETGKIHSVPKTNRVNYWGYSVNQKWLDKLGLQAPTTLDEFTEVIRTFSQDDPDGNGQDDTYGVSSVGPWGMQFLMTPFDLPTITTGVKDIDGEYKIKEKFAGYIPYLTYIRKIYAEGYLDPEFFTNKQYADREKQYQNRIGIRQEHQTAVINALNDVEDAIDRFTYCAPLANSKEEQPVYITPPMWGTWMISKDAKNIDTCLNLLDWGNSQEGVTLLSIGQEGIDYNSYDFDKRLVMRTEEQAKELTNKASSYITFAYALDGQSIVLPNGDTPERIDKFNKDFTAVKKVVKEVYVPNVRTPKLNDFGATNPDMVKKREEMELQYILGEVDEQQFKHFLENEYYPSIAEAEKEYIEVMEKMEQ